MIYLYLYIFVVLVLLCKLRVVLHLLKFHLVYIFYYSNLYQSNCLKFFFINLVFCTKKSNSLKIKFKDQKKRRTNKPRRNMNCIEKRILYIDSVTHKKNKKKMN